jgi:2-keto-myo-inositol isomerase
MTTASPITRRQALVHSGLALGAAFVGTRALGADPAARAEKTQFSFCLNTGTVRGQKLGIVRECEIAAQAGYQGIEPWVEAIEQYVKSGGALKDLKNRIADLGLTLEDAISFPEWIVDDDARRRQGLERARREMDMLAQLGGKRIAAPPAGATDQPGLDLLKAAERYRALLEIGDSLGIVPQLEMWGFSQNLFRLGQVAQVAIETGHPKACVLADVFHIYKGGGNPAGLKLVHSGMIHLFHMNDYPAEPPREKINDGYRIFPGDGVAPMAQMLRDLQALGGPKVLSLELFNQKYYEQDALEVAKAGLEKMKTAVKNALA